MVTSEKILQTVADLLKNISSLPIPVDSLAEANGIQLVSYDLGEEISGLLIVDAQSTTIGYNSNQSRVRNRFTIAHELGHYMLHSKEESIFIDKPQVKFRKENFSEEKKKEESEANMFAACLLMPEEMVTQELEAIDTNGSLSDAMVRTLAKRFDVSAVAMSWRLYKLGYNPF